MIKRIAHALLTALALTAVFTAAARAEDKPATPADVARADIAKTLGFVPGFFKAFPEIALPGVWEEMKGLQLNPNTALSGRTKELIGMAVAAQVPCKYCVYAHDEFARLNGASAAEVGEAVAVGGIERHWSAYFYGLQLDETKFRAEIARIIENGKKPQRPGAEIKVVDAKTALQDIEKTLGFVPEFLRKLPEAALPGAWRELEEVKLNPNTQLSIKHKALIALAVASQVPSRACVVAETEIARMAGATDREIAEAVGMAAITRNMSTLLNGQQVDERAFRADVDRLVAGARAAQKKTAAVSARRID